MDLFIGLLDHFVEIIESPISLFCIIIILLPTGRQRKGNLNSVNVYSTKKCLYHMNVLQVIICDMIEVIRCWDKRRSKIFPFLSGYLDDDFAGWMKVSQIWNTHANYVCYQTKAPEELPVSVDFDATVLFFDQSFSSCYPTSILFLTHFIWLLLYGSP